MTKVVVKFLFQILVLTFLLLIGHFFLFDNYDFSLKNSFVKQSYLYLIALNVFSFLILIAVKIKKEDSVGYVFLGLVLVKMVVSFVYLYPTIVSQISNKEYLILVFFALYFIYLIFETVVVVNLVKLNKY
jgi:hypothetical protein